MELMRIVFYEEENEQSQYQYRIELLETSLQRANDFVYENDIKPNTPLAKLIKIVEAYLSKVGMTRLNIKK